ncbi:hypothetical protein MXAN_6214 [Myxococcus xanthus DK 1622]|uniref:Uncharacterized protein n=1 Tax=Myxococcus xanthus (strain DK1622) TaxID=246197 RepID=Q1CZ28_MYXXD|nr:hypothetical protein MXAN_6214 [Myxococcus xanthus DK 1622]QZZ53845.1 hypothetical protein MyxoNM_31945 [Myxococcus xanthus]SDY13435.1 hypothetical protein SAMN05444383_11975 [Myxococcus xanthus]
MRPAVLSHATSTREEVDVILQRMGLGPWRPA